MSFNFDGVPDLENVDVDLGWGSETAIAGPNGAGKSTLIEILAGVRRAVTGSVERAGEVSLVVQRVTTLDALPLTVREVVAMGTWGKPPGSSMKIDAKERRSRVVEALDRVKLADLANAPFNSLSGGQRQRALLAQGMACRARIFLLDEPAAGFDAESRERTRSMLADEAHRGAAVVCVSHDEESIAAATSVITLECGRRIS